MNKAWHLWAIGYDDMARANQVREEIIRLGWGEGQVEKSLILLDIAVVVRQQDGSFTFDQQSFPVIGNILTCTVVGFLAGLAVGAPLIGATVGALAGGVGSAASASAAGIDSIFVREVESLCQSARQGRNHIRQSASWQAHLSPKPSAKCP
jgi:uncharacterized membrane protein